jgi:hypothetical protein
MTTGRHRFLHVGLAPGLAVATMFVGLVSAVPTDWLVSKWLHRKVPSSG